MVIGVLALQGGYAAHVAMLTQCGCVTQLVKTPADLQRVDGLIIPGGESSTLLMLLDTMQLRDALLTFHQQQKPIFGTCAGMILLARTVSEPTQASLGLIDIDVQRNAYGRQLASHIVQTTDVSVAEWTTSPLELVFIRAPQIIAQQSTVDTLICYQDMPVMVRQGNCFAASFHPELSSEQRIHRYFINCVQSHASETNTAADRI